MKKKLLILDNDQQTLAELKGIFAGNDIDLFPTSDARSALEYAGTEHPNVALVDIAISGESGLEVMKAIKEQSPHVWVIMLSGRTATRYAIAAMQQGAYDYLTKPLDRNQVKNVVERAMQNSLMSREVRMVGANAPEAVEAYEADVMIGSSPEIIEIWKMVGMLSDSDATVLIQGESGTGKELLARSIYNHSRRKNMPLITVNCAALPETLLESELFGHEKGAFTGAVARRIGRFEQSDKGTLFLDEIAEMTLKSQAKLLRVLENQGFSRVGGTETIKADVRIIAATNRSLIAAVREKSFRMDLFYRLKVMTLHLPPLRERVEDIPLLADYFVTQLARENYAPPLRISPAAQKLLQSHPWEGNIRELNNVIKSAAVICKGATLLPGDLSPLLDGGKAVSAGQPHSLSANSNKEMFQPLFETIAGTHEGSVYKRFIAEAEKSLINLAMDKYRNNEVHASRFLGISRNTLRQRLKAHNIK
jgi:two-component system nitrogen regulation response regulator GlnG